MLRTLSGIFLSVILAGSVLLAAGPVEPPELAGSGQTEDSSDPIFYVRLRSGQTWGGLPAGLSDDLLILVVRGQQQKVPRQDIVQVKVERVRSRHAALFPTILTGTLVGNLIIFRSEDHYGLDDPPFYAGHSEFSALGIFFWESAILGVSVGLGFLVDMLAPVDKVFNFWGDEQSNLKTWEELRRFVARSGRGGAGEKFHLTFQGGIVVPHISYRYKSLYEEAGLIVSRDGYSYGRPGEWEGHDINMLRRVQLTYSVHPSLEIGASVGWLGERAFRADESIGTYYYDRIVNQSMTSIGYFAVASYCPFWRGRPKTLSWNLGLGLGVAQTEFVLSYSRSYPYYDFEERSESRLHFCALSFTEVKVALSTSTSLGLAADFAFAPGYRGPAVPEAGISGPNLSLMNGSVGLVMEFHF